MLTLACNEFTSIGVIIFFQWINKQVFFKKPGARFPLPRVKSPSTVATVELLGQSQKEGSKRSHFKEGLRPTHSGWGTGVASELRAWVWVADWHILGLWPWGSVLTVKQKQQQDLFLGTLQGSEEMLEVRALAGGPRKTPAATVTHKLAPQTTAYSVYIPNAWHQIWLRVHA